MTGAYVSNMAMSDCTYTEDRKVKLPASFDLDVPGCKDWIDRVISLYGRSKDINDLAITVICTDTQGERFEIVQFHSNRRIVHFLSGKQ